MITKKWAIAGVILAPVVLLMALMVWASPPEQESGHQGRVDPHSSMGTAFTYQGQLKAGSELVTNNCEMAFRLYDQAVSGSQIGSAITTTVPITDGLFSARLDFGSSSFSGDRRWLAVKVKCPSDSGYVDLGRQELTATPYALYALQAPWSGLSGVPSGFADGMDNDSGGDITAVYAGQGLDGGGDGGAITLTVAFGGSGTADTVSHSDHVHDSRYYTQADSDTRFVNDDAGEVGDADISPGILSPDRIAGTAWTSSNDGPGSGLDADTVDGQHASNFARVDHYSIPGGGGIVTITIPHYTMFQISIGEAFGAPGKVGWVSGIENDDWFVWLGINSTGNTVHGVASLVSSAPVITLGTGITLSCPGNGQRELVLTSDYEDVRSFIVW